MLTRVQIDFLNRVCSDKWTEENEVISVEGDVNMYDMNLTEIPVQFSIVNGYFNCTANKLTTLKGTPNIINFYFECESNQLMTLEGGPKEVGGYYSCERNHLTNLIGAPDICNGNFWCDHNQLTSLEGCPKIITEHFFCKNQNLEYLWGIGRIEGHIHYNNYNEINKWIIKCMKRDIMFPYYTLEENINWIKQEQKYSSLLGAPEKIRQYFSPRILNLVDSGVYNESRILDYKKFSRLC